MSWKEKPKIKQKISRKKTDSPLGKINQEGGLREDRVSEKDQVTDIQRAEKVSEVKV